MRIEGWQAFAIKRRPPEHPAPWRWSGYNHERHYLIDGALNNVLFSRDKIEVASPRALALIAAAPEMEALLRECLENQSALILNSPDPRDIRWVQEIAALLLRIDAAKAGE